MIGTRTATWTGLFFTMLWVLAALLVGPGRATAEPPESDARWQEEAILTEPPRVPPPLNRHAAARVKVHLEVVEKSPQSPDRTSPALWTYGGTVPGPLIRVRQGDTLLFHLSNHPDNRHHHSIVLQGLTGPGGGAAASLTAPGRTSLFSFQALHSGLFLYHCGTDPVEEHVANGMFGLLLVEPPGGLEPVDREYYLVQSELPGLPPAGETEADGFGTEGKTGRPEAGYVVFNGADGALLGESGLTARTGEKVRLFVGNGGPNLTSSFAVIGEQFDLIAPDGQPQPQTGVRPVLQIPPGGTAMLELTLEAAGEYLLLDRALSRAFTQGARGILRVSGETDPAIFAGKLAEMPYRPDALGAGYDPETLAVRMRAGQRLYQAHCLPCHQEDGQGLMGPFPPLAGADYLLADTRRAIRTVIYGLKGPITVNGVRYNGLMPAFDLSNQEVADVLTYVLNSWSNAGGVVSAEEVEQAK